MFFIINDFIKFVRIDEHQNVLMGSKSNWMSTLRNMNPPVSALPVCPAGDVIRSITSLQLTSVSYFSDLMYKTNLNKSLSFFSDAPEGPIT